MKVPCLAFPETAKLFSTVAAPFDIPTSDVRKSAFLHLLTHACYPVFPGGWGVVSPLMMPSIFPCAVGRVCIFALEKCLFRSIVHGQVGLVIFLLSSGTRSVRFLNKKDRPLIWCNHLRLVLCLPCIWFVICLWSDPWEVSSVLRLCLYNFSL